MPKIALVQMSSTSDAQRNLAAMEARLAEAAGLGAKLVAFPEMAYLMGSPEEWRPWLGRYAELCDRFAGWARRHGVCLLPGSLREPVAGDPTRYHNTLPVFGPDGKVLASYRKLYLFKAKLPDREYDEGQHCVAGSSIVTAAAGGLAVGLSICFDLRFPELFRALKKRGADLVVLPAAFTVPTGKAHWLALIRARAIENQCFVAAPAQSGLVGEAKRTFGHSLVVSPWGEVLLDLGEGERVGVAEIDPARVAEAAGRVGSWPTPQPGLLPIA